MEAMQAAKSVPITERLRAIKIGNYTVDHGSHTKHIPVRTICEEAAQEIDQLKGECLLLADVLRDAFEVIKTIEDLATMGFDAEWGVLGAHAIGANHKRERIWILAHAVQRAMRFKLHDGDDA